MSGETLPRPSTIAIDGPVGAGKTSVGRALSQRLNYRFLDTGIMYRALAWLAMDLGIDVSDEEALGQLAWSAVIRLNDGEEGGVIVNDREVREELRRPAVDRTVSLVAKAPEVRRAMVEQQRQITERGKIVVVGRDVGTVVLPQADLKVFLDAPVSERARRRFQEMENRRDGANYKQVLQDLESRDEMDTKRAHSPLYPAADAHVVDTEGFDLTQVTEKVLALMGEG